MTTEKLHDAIGQLDDDLLLETQQLRAAPRRKIIPLRRYVSLAACLALLICGTVGYRMTGRMNRKAGAPAQLMMVQEAPAEAAPEMPMAAVTADSMEEAAPEMAAESALDAAANGAADLLLPVLTVSAGNISLQIPAGETEEIPQLRTSDNTLCLNWDAQPDDISAQSIPAEGEGEAIPAQIDEEILTLTEGDRIYRIFCLWPEGSAEYVLRVIWE